MLDMWWNYNVASGRRWNDSFPFLVCSMRWRPRNMSLLCSVVVHFPVVRSFVHPFPAGWLTGNAPPMIDRYQWHCHPIFVGNIRINDPENFGMYTIYSMAWTPSYAGSFSHACSQVILPKTRSVTTAITSSIGPIRWSMVSRSLLKK